MRNYEQIEALARAARVQRSAAIGIMLGDLLGEAWLRTENFAKSMGDYLSGRPEVPPQAPERP